MPQLTVLLVRSGETLADVAGAGATATPLRRHQRVDPPLTLRGYQQAHETYTALIQAIVDQTPVPTANSRGDDDGDGVIDPLRNLACFSAPLQACQSTALMLSTSGLARQDKLTWRYTTVDAAKSPSAVPIITVNDLCAAQPEVVACGGVATVVDAGLLHTATAPWNDARFKCPFMRVCVKEMKLTAGEFAKAWKEDRRVTTANRVLEVQYLANTEPNDPWSLVELTPKVNVCIDMLPVNKYLPPPRKGNLERKLPSSLLMPVEIEPTVQAVQAVSDAVWKARQVGCDTVLLAVPATTMQSLLNHIGGTTGATTGGSSTTKTTVCATPCAVVSVTASVTDARGAAGIAWTLVGAYTMPQLVANARAAVPIFPGPVDCLVPPPPDKDPASVPANQWSAFPPPEPEVIPNDYPDLPPFGSALSAPYPTVDTKGTIPRGSSGGAGPPSRGAPPSGGGRSGGPGPGGRSNGPGPGGRSNGPGTGGRSGGANRGGAGPGRDASAARGGRGPVGAGRGRPNRSPIPAM